jgi:hypothetical protein
MTWRLRCFSFADRIDRRETQFIQLSCTDELNSILANRSVILYIFIDELDIFPLMSATDKVWTTELTLINKNIRSIHNSLVQELTLDIENYRSV